MKRFAWLFLLATCSHAAPPPPAATPPLESSTIVADAAPAPPPAPVADAAIAVITPDAALGFRDFVPPPPLAQVSAPPVKAACAAGGAGFEAQRVTAALDAELRKTGGFVLPLMVVEGPRGYREPSATPTAYVRGEHGERLLAVGEASCGMPLPVMAIDRDGAVFEPEPVVRAAHTRTVATCDIPCFGCGAHMPEQTIYAEVPDGAHVDHDQVHQVALRMNVHNVFTYPGKHCIPRP